MPTIAIVGASLAGSSAAATLREEGFDGRVLLIGPSYHAVHGAGTTGGTMASIRCGPGSA